MMFVFIYPANLSNRVADKPYIKADASFNSLKCSLKSIKTTKKFRDANCLNDLHPICRWESANSVFDVAICVCPECVDLQRTAGGSLRAIAIGHEIGLKAKHRIRDPCLACSTHLAAQGRELLAVVEAISDWITGGPTMETCFKAIRIEVAAIWLRV